MPQNDTNGNELPDVKNDQTRHESKKYDSNSNTYKFFFFCILGLVLGIVFEIFNDQNRSKHCEDTKDVKLKYWVYPNKSSTIDREGFLKHVHLVLERVGYERKENDTPWDLLWAHDYPFTQLRPHLYKLKPHQKVNHFPATGYITNKVNLATSESKYIPKAFQLPSQKSEFLKYAQENRESMFLMKNNQHRGIVLKNVSEIEASDEEESFVQEFVRRPFLVDGYKFDIGVYTVITSVDPLRVYYYSGDVLFRYCREPYHPLDPGNKEQYVIQDEYRPTGEVPSLTTPHIKLGFGMKDCFDSYVRDQGMDPTKMWEDIQSAIREVYVKNENHIIDALKSYSSPDNFFELIRFDFIVDEGLGVHLLEANMSPNMYSAKLAQNRLLYQQVLYNLFTLVGVSDPVSKFKKEHPEEESAASAMVSSEKNIMVFASECAGQACAEGCEGVCALCRGCAGATLKRRLLRAHREHLHRGDYRRIFPPPMTPNQPADPSPVASMTSLNQLQYLWYQGKCDSDPAWCN